MLSSVVDALIAATEEARALWPELGVFSQQARANMPGLPGYRQLQFRPSRSLFCLVNDGLEGHMEDEGAVDWWGDAGLIQRTTDVVCSELLRAGEVTVPGLGTFGVQMRKTSADSSQYWVSFRAEPSVIRRLNPKDRNYAAALKLEWPEGVPEIDAGEPN